MVGIAIGLTLGSGSGLTAGGLTEGGPATGVAAGVGRLGVGDADEWAAGEDGLPD